MKVRVIVMAASVSLGLAMAQTNPPDQQKQATPQTGAAAATTAKPDVMETKTYKGVLVDMSCASHAAVGTAQTSTTSASTAPATTQPATDANSANRSAGESGESCAVSANSTQIGMKMSDGRTVRFDLVGNQRAQDGLKNNKHWTKDLSDGKPVHATVQGALNGDKLIVSSIN